MRLLVVSHYFWPEDMRVNDLVRGMRERGHEVTVLTNEPNYPEGRIYPAFRANPRAFASYHGAEVIRVPVVPRGNRKVWLALNYISFVISACTIGAWRLRGRKFDAIFAFQNSPLTAAVPAVMQRWLKRTPMAMWILDVWPETLIAIGVIRSRRMIHVAGKLSDWVYRRCDVILTQSQAFDENVQRHSGGRLAGRYFPNWVEPIFAVDREETTPPEMVRFKEKFVVMFAGNVGDAQAFPAIVEAADLCRDLEDVLWVIVGDGSMSEWVRQETARRGLTDRLIMLGRHPVERMPAFLASASALLVTLRPEPIWGMTIPGKLQNYLASGKPILALLDGEGSKVVTESGGGFVAPAGDSEGLARCVRHMRRMTPSQRCAMGAKGRDYARRHFDRDALFDDLARLLGQLRHPRADTGVKTP